MADPLRPNRRHLLTLAAALAAGANLPVAAQTLAESGSADGDPAAPLPLERVADGVFVYRAPYELLAPENDGAIANMGLVVGSEACAIIDTGNSRLAGERMLAAARGVTELPLRYVINTHMHPDHTLGNAAFEATGARFVAHAKMPRALSMRAETYLAQVERLLGPAARGTRIVLPDLLVERALELDLGNRPIRLEAHPTAHTDNDLTVRDMASETWFLGDLLFSGHIPTLDGSLNGWLALLDVLVERKAPRVVPGHGPASMVWPSASADERRYLEQVRADVRRLISEGATMADAPEGVAQSERPNWALFDEFNPRNAIAAYHEVEWE
ncbi:quinoprotein relay system zinc metallohydrolase 2 [Ancylobacter sp. A5.8]|uniref:quinoprotein relay system zinc metallohydrolase 2 n=1 Tax=Ancylobacter gelatini TaxID=2919920 RepID=UPI001F4DB58A|nr:quinoprotein relay system zinc metallohydrolase 2 [Ancylobacter gelatini]MCJ8144208.1 quinoprotein relay system zinc metallohydrolase 2 [Ancylobacter gelatini]